MKRCIKYFFGAVNFDHHRGVFTVTLIISAVCAVFGAAEMSVFGMVLSVVLAVTGIESHSVFSLRSKLIASSAISEKYQCVFLPMINAAARTVSLIIIAVPVIVMLLSGADRLYYTAYLLFAAVMLAAEGLATVISAICTKGIMLPFLFMELPVFVGMMIPLNEDIESDSGINAFLTSVGIGGAVVINIAVILLFWLLHYIVSAKNYKNDRISRSMNKAIIQ